MGRKKKAIEAPKPGETERNKGPELVEDNDRDVFYWAKTTEQLLYAKRALEHRNGLDDLEIQDVLDLIDEVVGRRDTMRIERENTLEITTERDELKRERDDLIRRLDAVEMDRDTLRELIAEAAAILR